MAGKRILVRLTAENYLGALESPATNPVAKERVYYDGKTEVALTGSQESVPFSDMEFRTETGETVACSYAFLDAKEEDVYSFAGNLLRWISSTTGDYTLRVTAEETNTSQGGSFDVTVHIYPKEQAVTFVENWSRTKFNLSYSLEGITVQRYTGSLAVPDGTRLVAAFYDAEGRFLALGGTAYNMDGTFEPFTVPGVQRAAAVTVFFVSPEWAPCYQHGTQALPDW